MKATDGVEVRQDNTEQVVNGIDTAINRALEKIGLTAEGYAKKLTPVDTGTLRNSVTHAVDSGQGCVYIGTNVEYGPYIELGHRNYPGANGGRGFLRPAAQDHGAQYRQILQSELRNA